MTVECPELLAEVRLQPCCWCSGGPSEAAHLFAKGIGGGGRIDTAWNVVPLCRRCHQSQHLGNSPKIDDLLDIAAARCGVASGSILAAIWWLRRTPNGATESRVRAELAGLPAEARGLVDAVLQKRAA